MNFWRKGKLAIAQAMHLDLTHPQVHYARFLAGHLAGVSRWLDVGCGHQLVPPDKMSVQQQRVCFGQVPCLVGIDVDPAIVEHPLLTARVMGFGGRLPFAAESFDLVTANMVLEHVQNPAEFLADIHRVLRPDGHFIFHTPNAQYYLVALARLTPEWLKRNLIWILERRRDEDIFTTYYKLNTPQTITRFANNSGFEVDTLAIKGGDGAFGALGPVGWGECAVLKLLSWLGGGRFNSNLIVSLRKPASQK